MNIAKVTDHAGDVHLIRCNSLARAERYVSKKLRRRLHSRFIGPEEVARAAQTGIDVEDMDGILEVAADLITAGLAVILVMILIDLLARAFGA